MTRLRDATRAAAGSLPLLLLATLLATLAGPVGPPATVPPAGIDLKDQYGQRHLLAFPRTNLLVISVADREGSRQVPAWIEPLKARYGGRVVMEGVADVRKVPSFLRGMIESKFRKQHPHPVMLDWTGEVSDQLGATKGVVTLLLVDLNGTPVARASGPASTGGLDSFCQAIDRYLAPRP
ncbi:MAG TPA: hypothetical protein DCM86_12470 [Verrucomicrobiales bacterium]|nr:hypothetical protein [Verrucomicrobiales bacterium]